MFVGHNAGWKQEANIGKANNQNFVQIPFDKFVKMLQYKLAEAGITLEGVDEAYTSRCSALDGEVVGEHDNYAGKRIKRGLFRSRSGKLINADVNGSLNILRKRLGHDFKISSKVHNPVKLKHEVRDVPWEETSG